MALMFENRITFYKIINFCCCGFIYLFRKIISTFAAIKIKAICNRFYIFDFTQMNSQIP
jgi:hypothetical protein